MMVNCMFHQRKELEDDYFYSLLGKCRNDAVGDDFQSLWYTNSCRLAICDKIAIMAYIETKKIT